jgi:hypothetical protein
MVGAVCAGGAASLDGPDGAACAPATESATVARFAIPIVAPGETPNHRPNLANDAVTLAGAAWTTAPTGDAGGPCDATTGLPVVTAGGAELELRLVTDADDRESFARAPGAAPTPEELQLSSFATAGKLAGSYASIPPTDTRPDADLTVKWTPPATPDVPSGGLLVHFHFVLRDGRGGLDWLHRAACVTAP